jgi:hypothetical protein
METELMSAVVAGKLTVKLKVFSAASPPLMVPAEGVPTPPVVGVIVPANLYPGAAFSTMLAV